MDLVRAILLCLVVALAPSVALASEPLSAEQQKQLSALIEDGKNAYDRGEFEASLQDFRQAYDLYQHPDIIYRIALCYERLGEDQQAVKFYRQFLAEAPDAPERPRIEKTIEVIEGRISKSEIRVTTEPTGAVVYVDDEANGAAGYTPTALAVKPGNYKLIVKKQGFEPVRELVTVSAGQSVQVRYQLSKASASDAPVKTHAKAKRARSAPSVKFLTLASIGVAAGVTSIVFFGLNSKKRQELDEIDSQERQNVSRTHREQVARQATTNLVVAVSSASVAAFALIWAYGTWVSDRNAAQQASAPTRDSTAGLTFGWSNGPVLGYGFRF